MRNPLLTNLFKRYSHKVGLPPGTLVYVGEQREEPIQINLIDYNESYLHESTVGTVGECAAFKNAETVTWIHIQGIHEADFISEIGEHFDINSLILEDIMNPTQLPKIEVFDEYIFMILRTLRYNPDTCSVSDEPINLIIGQNYVILIQESGEKLFKPIHNRIVNQHGRIRKMQSGYLAYALIDLIVDNYFIVVEQINDQIELVEEETITNPTPEILKKINHLRQQLLLLRKPILPLRDVINEVISDETPIFKDETDQYFRDVNDHLIQVIQTLEILRMSVSGLFDTYSSALNHKMNEVMKVLTIVATLFIPLTFIAGIYGMNFKIMPELETQWGYPIVLSIMGLIGITMFIFFKIKKWL
ncbi:MAG: magnesium/cobalt transporter CorA [Candidatus Poribacteria bacterium]|nr:magnesium/cobalt transporter CorA [Candidatus Poribacteria bacterium]